MGGRIGRALEYEAGKHRRLARERRACNLLRLPPEHLGKVLAQTRVSECVLNLGLDAIR
jgi:hypothetical protein